MSLSLRFIFGYRGEQYSQSEKTVDNSKFSKDLLSVLRYFFSSPVGDEYALRLSYNNEFFSAVKESVEKSIDASNRSRYTQSDIRLAIGRVLMDKFGIEYKTDEKP